MCWRTITTRRWRCRWRSRARTSDLDAHGRFMRDLEARGQAGPRRGIPARRCRTAPPRPERQGPDAARACRAAGLCQARSGCGIDRQRRCPTIRISMSSCRAISRRSRAEASRPRSSAIASSAKSSPTALANRIVNLAGPVFVARMKEMSGAPAARIVRGLYRGRRRLRARCLKGAHRCAGRAHAGRRPDRHVCRDRGNPAPAWTVVPRPMSPPTRI